MRGSSRNCAGGLQALDRSPLTGIWVGVGEMDSESARIRRLGFNIWWAQQIHECDDPELREEMAEALDRHIIQGQAARYGWTDLSPEQLELVATAIPYADKLAAAFCAKGFAKPDDHRFDLAREAAVRGLHRAARRFDPAKGAKFTTYAFLWIKGELMRLLKGDELEARDISIDMPNDPGDPEGDTLADVTEAPESEPPIDGRALLRAVEPYLSAVQRDILDGRLLADVKVPQREIAEKYGISVPRVSYLEKRLPDRVISVAQKSQRMKIGK
jgi:RNA polymerase sigma factor (sigma-70 family)